MAKACPGTPHSTRFHRPCARIGAARGLERRAADGAVVVELFGLQRLDILRIRQSEKGQDSAGCCSEHCRTGAAAKSADSRIDLDTCSRHLNSVALVSCPLATLLL